MYWIILFVASFCSMGSVLAADDLLAVAQKSGRCKTFLKWIQLAGLTQTLKDYSSLTIFAPVDEGFSRLPKEVLDALVRPTNKPELANVLLAHVVKGKMMASDLKTLTATTLGGSKVHLVRDDDSLMYGDANVVKADLQASNGVLHLIDKIILPEQKNLSLKKKETSGRYALQLKRPAVRGSGCGSRAGTGNGAI